MADVLLVEDDAVIREVVTYQLERAGHHVAAAEDGVSALQKFRESEPQLVILDLMLPRLAGLDVLRAVREESEASVILVTARDTEADKIAGFDLGADDYITKPFSVRELMARVRVALKRSASAVIQADVTRVAGTDIEIDIARHEVRKQGRVLQLSPKEFELLSYLVRHPNQVCSRDQILESVWGYAYGGDTRTVDVHMHGVRRQLEDDPKRPRYLRTVRQYGYKFVTE